MIEEALLPRDSLYNWRKKGWDHFQKLWSLRRKSEAFQYVPAESLLLPKPLEKETFTTISPECEGEHKCVFIDGFFNPQNSHLPDGIVALSLEEAMRTYGVFLQNQSRRFLKEESDPLSALNSAVHGRGLFLYIPPHFEGTGPIQIHNHFTTHEMAAPRIQVYLGQGARLSLVQTTSFSIEPFFCNSVLELLLEEESLCDLYDTQIFPSSARYFGAVRASLKQKSRFNSLSLMTGAKTARTSYKVQLLEPESEALLQGLSVLKDEKQNHIHAVLEHAAPETRSRQNFKSVLYGKSRSSFEGKIWVHPIAQKTESYQRTASLSLSPDAESFAKPNLEIFADDVKASHGATMAKISEDELFYLRSRGLTKAAAKEWLVKGFCEELLRAMPFDALRRKFQNA